MSGQENHPDFSSGSGEGSYPGHDFGSGSGEVGSGFIGDSSGEISDGGNSGSGGHGGDTGFTDPSDWSSESGDSGYTTSHGSTSVSGYSDSDEYSGDDDDTDQSYVATTVSSGSVDNGMTSPVFTITARNFVVNLDCQEWLAHSGNHPPCNTISWSISRSICQVLTPDDWSILERAVRTSGSQVIHQLPNLNDL